MNRLLRHGPRVALGAVAVIITIGCFGGPTTISAKKLRVSPPALMIAKKVPRTAYIVVDPDKIPASLTVLVDGKPRGGTITDVQEFANRDLKRAFSNYFENVEVVAPGWVPPPTEHAVIDARVDRIEVRRAGSSGGVSYGFAALTWGLGMRISESSDYVYTFAGESVSPPGGDPNLVFRSMFEAAITDMLKGYTDKQIHDRLLSVSSGDKPAPTVDTTTM